VPRASFLELVARNVFGDYLSEKVAANTLFSKAVSSDFFAPLIALVDACCCSADDLFGGSRLENFFT
jgi:hypothetical protein